MPFLFIGIFLVVVGSILKGVARKDKDKEGAFGASQLVFAGIAFIVLFGLLYRSTILFFSA